MRVSVDEDTNTVWAVSNNGGSPNGSAIQFSGLTLKVLKTVPLNGVNVNVVGLNRKTGKYYVTNYSNGEIEVYDKQFNHLTTVPDDNSSYLAVNEKTNKIYVTNYWDGTVSVIDGSTDTIIGNPIQVGVAITPNDCYKTSRGPTLTVRTMIAFQRWTALRWMQRPTASLLSAQMMARWQQLMVTPIR